MIGIGNISKTVTAPDFCGAGVVKKLTKHSQLGVFKVVSMIFKLPGFYGKQWPA